MADLTVNDYLNFFKRLDFRKKVSILSELTSILNSDLSNHELQKEKGEEMSDSEFLDSLFGVWEGETDLTEESIINRTISNRNIDLN